MMLPLLIPHQDGRFVFKGYMNQLNEQIESIEEIKIGALKLLEKYESVTKIKQEDEVLLSLQLLVSCTVSYTMFLNHVKKGITC
jgi:hypothetical protein